MELIIKSNNESSIAKIVALAKKLNVTVIEHADANELSSVKKDLKDFILNFKADNKTSFVNPSEWQREQRNDRNLPFSH